MPSSHLILCPFSYHLQSFPASGSFQMSQFSTSGGQSIGVSASASVLAKNIQDWFPSGWTGWISLQSKGLSRVFFNTTVQKHQFFGAQLQECLNPTYCGISCPPLGDSDSASTFHILLQTPTGTLPYFPLVSVKMSLPQWHFKIANHPLPAPFSFPWHYYVILFKTVNVFLTSVGMYAPLKEEFGYRTVRWFYLLVKGIIKY